MLHQKRLLHELEEDDSKDNFDATPPQNSPFEYLSKHFY
jgi:hypothetical protein